MPERSLLPAGLISRRSLLGTAATIAATPALAEGCQIGPPPHEKGPKVWMDLDQVELDAAYDQTVYAPMITVTYGTFETPEFQRQSRDFAAAVKAAGKPVELLEAPDFNHFEMCESIGNPYGPNGSAALKLMKLA
jgi:hypothetical protein